MPKNKSSSDLSLLPFEKALQSLTLVLKEKENAITRDAAIQRFEYTFELSWKVLKRYFKINNNLEIFNVKDIFREAGKQSLIEKVEKWFEYLEARSLTSHTYDKEIAEKVLQYLPEFQKELKNFISKVKN